MRSSEGMGPKVPLRVPFRKVVVEGLSAGCKVRVYTDGVRMLELEENAEYELESPLVKGSIVQAEIVGNHSCVSVRLELK
jgi:hypothetical protein